MSLLSGDKFGDILSASPDDAILPIGICLERNDLPAGKQILSFGGRRLMEREVAMNFRDIISTT